MKRPRKYDNEPTSLVIVGTVKGVKRKTILEGGAEEVHNQAARMLQEAGESVVAGELGRAWWDRAIRVDRQTPWTTPYRGKNGIKLKHHVLRWREPK